MNPKEQFMYDQRMKQQEAMRAAQARAMMGEKSAGGPPKQNQLQDVMRQAEQRAAMNPKEQYMYDQRMKQQEAMRAAQARAMMGEKSAGGPPKQ